MSAGKRADRRISLLQSSPAAYPGHLLFLLSVLLLLAACTGRPAALAPEEPLQVVLQVDGEAYNLTTETSNVRELLEEAGVSTSDLDLVEPPLFTPLQAGMFIKIVRVKEEIEVVEETLSFSRKLVRSEVMSVDEPPRIIQGGKAGRQEITVRIVYHDNVEVDRQRTQVTLLEEPRDEIVMIGVGNTAGSIVFPGIIAYISDGNSILLRGSTVFPTQLDTGDNLDGRVFRLSPSGSHLLYTRITSDTARFNNSLWLLSTDRGAKPRDLGVKNVLWADWNPSRTASLQIAYTTGNPSEQPPGWEANNDLWIASLYDNEEFPFDPEQIVEVYPATYGWWGGNYAWSPDGRFIAYSYADEVGLIDLEERQDRHRTQLYTFTEYNTGADWVWLPSLSWSPDGRYLAFSGYRGSAADASDFDTWVVDTTNGVTGRFAQQAGIWSHPHWSPPASNPLNAEQVTSHIAFLRATNPLDSLSSSYTLWLMDADGSNQHQVYPPVGENSRFPREEQFMAWGPSGRDLAFIFDNALYLLNLDRNTAYSLTEDDALISRPTWAPYGDAITPEIAESRVTPFNSSGSRPGVPDEERLLEEE